MHLQHICQFNKLVFSPYFLFHKLLNYLVMFQCNEHVEMNTFCVV